MSAKNNKIYWKAASMNSKVQIALYSANSKGKTRQVFKPKTVVVNMKILYLVTGKNHQNFNINYLIIITSIIGQSTMLLEQA